MNVIHISARVIACFVFVGLPAISQPLPTSRPDRVGLSPERLDRLTEYFMSEIAEKRLPGAVMLVARKGRIAYFEALGTQDPATGARMRKDSIFRIWSMTKPFVSVATMMLVEEGKVSLSDPVSSYLPDFAKLEVSVELVDPETRKATYSSVPVKRQITVHDLMRHTSGLPGAFAVATNAQIKEAYQNVVLEPMEITSAEFAARIAKAPLAHQPGAAFEYGASTDVLGRVLEVASGMRLSEVLERRIFQPLGMRDTGFHVPDASQGRLAQTFDTVPGTNTPVKLFDPKRRPAMDSGGGRGVGTAGDFVRFCQMLLNGGRLDGVRLLSRTTVRLMTSDHLGSATVAGMGPGELTFNTPGYTFGLGFGVRREAGGASLPGSPGEYLWTGTFNTLFFVDPQEELIGIFMSVGTGSAIRFNHRVKFKQLVYQAIVD